MSDNAYSRRVTGALNDLHCGAHSVRSRYHCNNGRAISSFIARDMADNVQRSARPPRRYTRTPRLRIVQRLPPAEPPPSAPSRKTIFDAQAEPSVPIDRHSTFPLRRRGKDPLFI